MPQEVGCCTRAERNDSLNPTLGESVAIPWEAIVYLNQDHLYVRVTYPLYTCDNM